MSEAEEIAISILNNVLNDLMKNISEMSFDIVNEIVNSSFENAQKPSAHSCSCVSNTKKIKEWNEKFLWLIINTIKDHMTLLLSMTGADS